MQASNVPVLIIGAGPTGLTLAIECCRHDVPFRLVVQNPEPSQFTKALGIWHGTMQVLRAQGILESFLAISIPTEQLTFADRGKPVGTISPLDYDFYGLRGPVMLGQNETERLLTEHLEKLGGKVERGVTVTAIDQKAQQIQVTLQHKEGSIERCQADYLAGCDGARSIVRKTLEVLHQTEFKGYTEPQVFLLADVEYDGEYQNNQIMISWSDTGSLALFPVTQKILRIIGIRTNGQEHPPTLEEFQTLMDTHGPQGLRLKNPTWLSIFKINERLSAHYQHARIFLLGDAAHIHSPAGGQGMNTGMQDAYNLG